MRALTLWQPWASYVALGLKRYETRSWGTPYRGELAIHAAARKLGAFERELLEEHPLPYELPFGAVVATCRLADVLPTTKAMELQPDPRELELGDFSVGRYAWVLQDVLPLVVPIPVPGARGLWEWVPR